MIYFVSEQFLKTYGMITQNVDAKEFAPLIQYSAKAFIRNKIGSIFFDDLLSKYNNQTLNQAETSLVSLMQYSIAWRATAEATLTLSYQLKNKGIQKQKDDNSEPADMKEVTFMYDNFIQKAAYFEAELKTFLMANKNNYPLFISIDNKDSIFKNDEFNAKGDSFNEGIGIIII